MARHAGDLRRATARHGQPHDGCPAQVPGLKMVEPGLGPNRVEYLVPSAVADRLAVRLGDDGYARSLSPSSVQRGPQFLGAGNRKRRAGLLLPY